MGAEAAGQMVYRGKCPQVRVKEVTEPGLQADSPRIEEVWHAIRCAGPGGSLGLDVGRDAGGAPGRRGNRVVPGGPRDLPVVAFGIGEVRIAALEELCLRRFLRHGGTGVPGAPDEGVDVLWPVRGDDDRAADAAVPELRRGVRVGAELVDAEQREEGATQLEDGEAVAVQRLRPTQPTVELTHAERDDVRKWQLLLHGSLLCRTNGCRRLPGDGDLSHIPCPHRGRRRRRAAYRPGPAHASP